MSMRGRPTLYKPENAELARKFCMLGATNEDLARCFEVSRSTIDHWIDTIPEFAEAVREGRDLADAAVIQKLYSRAMGFTTEIKKHVIYRGELREIPMTLYYPPDIQACIFWLRNRRRRDWHEKGKGPAGRRPDHQRARGRLRACAAGRDQGRRRRRRQP